MLHVIVNSIVRNIKIVILSTGQKIVRLIMVKGLFL